MSTFKEAADILKAFATSQKFADIDFFNNSKYPSFSEFKIGILKNIESINEYNVNEKIGSSITIHDTPDIETIFIGKKQYSNTEIYKSIFRNHADEINDFINKNKELEIRTRTMKKNKEEIKGLDIVRRELEILITTPKIAESIKKKNIKRLNVLHEKINNYKKENKIIGNEIKNFLISIDNVHNVLNDIEILFDTIDLNSDKKFKNNQSIKFVNEIQKEGFVSDIKKFLLHKNIDEDVLFKFELSKGQKFEEVIFFKDSSIAYKKDDKITALPISSIEYQKVSKEICEELVRFKLRKKGFYQSLFIEKLRDENYNINQCMTAIYSLLKYEQILNNYKFNIVEMLKKKSLEHFDDEIHKVKKKHDVNSLASSIISSKYKHLYTDKIYAQIEELYDMKVTKIELQDNIGKKIASFTTSIALSNALKKYIHSLNDFNMDAMLDKVERYNTEIILKNDNLLTVKINDFEGSNKLGTDSWCISRSETHFDSYVGRENLQFFIYDFSKESNTKESMLGITLKNDGNYSAAHYKNDDELCESSKLFKKMHMEILMNNKTMFNMDDSLKDKLADYERENYSKKMKIKNAI